MRTKLLPILFLSIIFNFEAYSQDRYAQFEKMVNTSNGQFSMSIPVANLASSDGQTFGVGLSYAGNVQMNQPASMVGLGWNINVGSIKRIQNGWPDDFFPTYSGGYHSMTTEDELNASTGAVISTEDEIGTGLLYGLSAAGAYSGNPIKSDATFVPPLFGAGQGCVPDFDQFVLSGNGPSGAFSLDYFPKEEDLDGEHLKKSNPISLYPTDIESEELGATVTRFAQQVASQTNTNVQPADARIMTLDNDPLGNVYIKYYTQTDIKASGGAPGFIPYFTSAFYTENENFAQGQILAFTVINSEGLKYHYSLPVFDYTQSNYYDLDGGVVQNSSSDKVRNIERSPIVASEWKLTAITGPNYKDLGAAGFGPEDRGYWVKLNYATATIPTPGGEIHSRFPYFGLHFNPGNQDEEIEGLENKELNKQGSVSIKDLQVYKIQSIESDLETLVFYYEFRDDEYYLTLDNKSLPNVRIKRIARYDNIGLSISPSASNPSIPTAFTGNLSYNQCFFEADFDPQVSQLLSSVAFQYDYSLQPEYDGNVNNFTNGGLSSLRNGTTDLINVINRKSSLSTDGKLTLKDIVVYSSANQEVNRYSFGYSALNPSYNVNNHDETGNYINLSSPSGLRLRNLNTTQDNLSHNWLIDEVTFPNRVKLEVLYEEALYSQGLPGVSVDKELHVPLNYVHAASGPGNMYLLEDDHKKVFFNNSGINRWFFIKSQYERAWIYEQQSNPNDKSIGYYITNYNSLLINRVNTLGQSIDANGNFTDGKKVTYNSSTREVTMHNNQTYNGTVGTGYTLDSWNNIEDVYMAFKDSYYRSGISRVKELRIYDNTSASVFAKLSYSYEDPRITLRKFETRYLGSPNGVSFGGIANAHNSVDRGVIYGKVNIKKTDKNGTDITNSSFYYDLRNEVNVSSKVVSRDPGACYIMPSWLDDYSPLSFYKFARANPIVSTRTYRGPFTTYPDSWADIAPDILVQAFNTYLDNFYQINNISSSDSDLVELHLPNTPFVSMSGTFLAGTAPGGDGALKISTSTCSCEGVIVPTYTAIPNGPPYWIPFKFPNPLAGTSEIHFHTDIKRYHGRLGQLKKFEVRDGNGNLQISKEYFYEIKGFKSNTYFAQMGLGQNDYFKYVTDYEHYYLAPVKIVTLENGQSISENLLSFDAASGSPIKTLSVSANAYVKGEKTYFNNKYDYVKWNKTGPLIGLTKSVGYQVDATRYVQKENIANGSSNGWEDSYTENSVKYLRKNILDVSTRSSVTQYMPTQNFLNQFYQLEVEDPETDPIKELLIKQHFDVNQYDILKVSLPNSQSESVSYLETSYTPLQGDVIVPTSTETYLTTEFTPSSNELSINNSQIQILDDEFSTLQEYNLVTELYGSTRYYNRFKLPFLESKVLPLSSSSATGFEDIDSDNNLFEGNFFQTYYRTTAETNSGIEAHTGEAYLKLPQSSSYFTIYHDPDLRDFKVGGDYSLSFWIRTADLIGDPRIKFSINGDVALTPYQASVQAYLSTINEKVEFGDWTLVTLSVTVPEGFKVSSSTYTIPQMGGGTTTIDGGLKIEMMNNGGDLIVDDLRFYPSAYPIEVVVYDLKNKRVSAKLDALNHGSKLIYDARGRVVQTYREDVQGFYLTKQTNYND